VSLDDVQVRLVDDLDDVEAFIAWMRSYSASGEPLAIDTESTGYYWHSGDYVRLVQIGDARFGWSLPWRRWSGLFAEAIAIFDGPIDMMNSKFDWSFLDAAGVTLPQHRIRDVGVASHILEPHMSRALKNQAARHVDPRARASQGVLERAFAENNWSWRTVPETYHGYWFYGGLDTVLTRQLADHHLPLVAAQAPYAYEVENAYQWVAQKMEAHGAPIDVEYAQSYYQRFTDYCFEVEDWCRAEYNVKPGSNQAVVKVLADAGFEFSKGTKSGAVALDAEVLEGIDHPLAQAVLKRRQLQKLASTYLAFYVENIQTSGCVHPTLNTLGARTGRCSMDHPNLQNLPRAAERNPGATVIRNCIHARPAHTLLMCDFDQIEMRGLAIMSGDPGLIAAFAQPDDFFVTIARNIFSDPHLVKSDPRRQPTKNSMYAKIYGAGLAKQAATAGVSIDQMRFVSDSLNAAYPGIERFSRRIFNEALERKQDDGYGWAECPLSGRRHYADPGKEYALVNYLIQGWAAFLFKLKQLELDAAGLGEYMVAPVHDEIILEVPNRLLEDVVYTLRKVMNDATSFPVPITASVSYGERWGDKKEWDKT
jgi:DNA polymerase-1